MILGPTILLQLVKEKNLVTNLSERELTNPEGAGFDLRMAEAYTIHGDAFLGETERKTPEVTRIDSYEEGKTKKLIIKPNDFFLVSTIEEVHMPLDLTASFKPRSTTYRSGLFIRSGNIAPGYEGKLTFGIKNEGPVTITIEYGARIIHIQFEEVLGGGSEYRGQWQGGRVTTKKKETQV